MSDRRLRQKSEQFSRKIDTKTAAVPVSVKKQAKVEPREINPYLVAFFAFVIFGSAIMGLFTTLGKPLVKA